MGLKVMVSVGKDGSGDIKAKDGKRSILGVSQ